MGALAEAIKALVLAVSETKIDGLDYIHFLRFIHSFCEGWRTRVADNANAESVTVGHLVESLMMIAMYVRNGSAEQESPPPKAVN